MFPNIPPKFDYTFKQGLILHTISLMLFEFYRNFFTINKHCQRAQQLHSLNLHLFVPGRTIEQPDL